MVIVKTMFKSSKTAAFYASLSVYHIANESTAVTLKVGERILANH